MGVRLLQIMSLFAADHEMFDAGLQVFPFLADLVGLVGVNLRIVLGAVGDGVEQLAELTDHFAGFAHDRLFRIACAAWVGIGDEETAGLVADPADQADVLGLYIKLAHPVERIFGARLVGVVPLRGRLAPLVDQRGGELQRGRHGLDAAFLHRLADHVV